MTAIGGSIESVSIRGRLFPVAADADGARKLGGFENEIQANGDGSARIVKTRVPWMLDGLTLEVDETRGDQEFLQEISDGQDFVTIVITYASQKSWQGLGIVSGELSFSSQTSTAEVTLSGPGPLTQQ